MQSWILEHGPVKLSTFLINYHVGDIVDIKANAAQQKGMPHKYYHGYVSINDCEIGFNRWL